MRTTETNKYDSLFDHIVHYSGIMYDRNLKSHGTEIDKNDIVNEVIAINCQTHEQVIKAVRDVVFKQKRYLLHRRQQCQNCDITGEKVCNKCGPRPVSEFYIRIDSRTGYRYLCNLCKECERKRHNQQYYRKKELKQIA